MLSRIAAGILLLLAAMVLITAHQSWRNTQAADRVRGVAATEPATTGAAPDSGDEVARQAADPNIHVFIQHTAGEESAADAADLAHFLEDRGFAVADIRAVQFEIDRPSVRFFYERDRADSARLVKALRAFFADAPARAPHGTIDLTHTPQKPDAGEVEVWMVAH